MQSDCATSKVIELDIYHLGFLEWKSFSWLEVVILLLLLLKRIIEDPPHVSGALDSLLGKSRNASYIKNDSVIGSIWRTGDNCLLRNWRPLANKLESKEALNKRKWKKLNIQDMLRQPTTNNKAVYNEQNHCNRFSWC